MTAKAKSKYRGSSNVAKKFVTALTKTATTAVTHW